MANTRGTVDYRDGQFVAQFDYDADLVEEIKRLPQRRWERAAQAWFVPRHHASATGLLRLARGQGWRLSAAASAVFGELQEQANAAEYSVDVVQGSFGEPWFFCKLGLDDELRRRVAAIPEVFADGAEWWVPAYRADCAELLLDIVQADMRLEVSDAGWRLLAEPDESYRETCLVPEPELEDVLACTAALGTLEVEAVAEDAAP